MEWSVVGLGRLYKRPSNFNVQYLLAITFDFDDTLWCDLSYSDWVNKVPRIDLEDSFTNITGSVFC
jgi:hypothetical protein